MLSASSAKKYIPALIGAGICLFFIKSGVLTIFFLAPLGFLALKCNYRIAWTAVLFTIFGNVLLAMQTALFRGIPFAEFIWDIVFFSAIVSIFVCIMAPPPYIKTRVSGVIRFITGSCLGALLFIGIFYRAMASPGFLNYVTAMLNSLVSMYRFSGSDVVQNALLGSLTGEVIIEFMKVITLRGGSLISCVILFFISRQASLILYRLSFLGKGTRSRGAAFPKAGSFMAFHVSPGIIWILSLSLLLVVLTRIARLGIPEIFLWNILILCIILYLAQGLGIIQFFLNRPAIPFFLKFFLTVLLIVLIFSPAVNLVLLAGVILLGIAENWAPLRAPKPNGPPSTPEGENDGN